MMKLGVGGSRWQAEEEIRVDESVLSDFGAVALCAARPSLQSLWPVFITLFWSSHCGQFISCVRAAGTSPFSPDPCHSLMTVFGAARSCRPLPALIIDLGLWGVEAQDSVNYTCKNGVVFARCGRGKAVGIWLLNKKQKRVLEIFKKSVYLFIF